MNKSIYLVGLNHRTAAVEIREQYALTSTENFEQGLLDACPVRECMALSTCNRVEILCVADPVHDTESTLESIVDYWATACQGQASALFPHVYQYKDLEAVNHLFTVAASLDSLVMGEPQILGQLKDAYRAAVDKGTARTVVNRLLHKSFSVAKRVRTETAVASSAVSISFAAVQLARKIFGDLTGRAAMLIGAGEMAELAATHLKTSGVTELYIANRTFSRAKELADSLGGQPVEFQNLTKVLPQADIVISSTGSPTAILKARDVRQVLKQRKHRSMFFIDIAVPRDIDPDVNQLDNVYLYDIDDLKEVVEENMASRRAEALKAQAVVQEETATFATWLESLALQPTIVELMDRGRDVAERELAKTLKRIGPVGQGTVEALETLVNSIAKKVLHEPICFLKRDTRMQGDVEQTLAQVRRMFRLDEPVDPSMENGEENGCRLDEDEE